MDSEPASKSLRIGDRVRIVRRPSDWERLQPTTRRCYDLLIREQVVLTVDELDEVGHPWITYERPLEGGGSAFDTLAINDDSWELVEGNPQG